MRPPVGDVPLRVTVPVAEDPPATDEVLSVKLVNRGGVTVNVDVTVVPPEVADNVAAIEEATE
jgi:translation elongation factor EF-1alpha